VVLPESPIDPKTGTFTFRRYGATYKDPSTADGNFRNKAEVSQSRKIIGHRWVGHMCELLLIMVG